MSNFFKSVVKWWLARKLPADLKAGDVCMVQSGDGHLKVAKVLAVDDSGVHVRLYREKFSEVPRLVNSASLSIGTIHDAEKGIGHLPLARATFAAWQPVRIQHEPVLEDELEGYEIWKEANGGVWD